MPNWKHSPIKPINKHCNRTVDFTFALYNEEGFECHSADYPFRVVTASSMACLEFSVPFKQSYHASDATWMRLEWPQDLSKSFMPSSGESIVLHPDIGRWQSKDGIMQPIGIMWTPSSGDRPGYFAIIDSNRNEEFPKGGTWFFAPALIWWTLRTRAE